jgi:hypothetical protein
MNEEKQKNVKFLNIAFIEGKSKSSMIISALVSRRKLIAKGKDWLKIRRNSFFVKKASKMKNNNKSLNCSKIVQKDSKMNKMLIFDRQFSLFI